MTDRRLLASNGRVAHASLKGVVDAECFVEGSHMSVVSSVAAVLDKPGGARERELRFGDRFLCLEERAGFVFGVSVKDGYVGVIAAYALEAMPDPTHEVATRATHALIEPDVKATDEPVPLSLGSRVHVADVRDAWSEIATSTGAPRFVPTSHLRALSDERPDPVTVARLCLGAPYLWGGNSTWGIDCSGLMQLAYHMAGLACDADSDQQEAMPGKRLPENVELTAGDLVFWRGHVAMATGDGALIHANAHHMQVVEEPAGEAFERIRSTETGDVTSILRPELQKLPEAWPTKG